VTSPAPLKTSLPRLLAGFALVALGLGPARAQIVLNVDWSDLHAVTFTASGNAPAIDYSGTLGFNDGIALLGFFGAHAVNVQDLDGGSPAAGVTLTDGANSATSTSIFNRLSSWKDSDPTVYTNGGTGSDLTLWNDSGATKFSFSTGSAAFNGVATFDLSGYSTFTNFFPALNATGTVEIWNGHGSLGTWKVTGAPSAIPEPSTYAVLAGLGALVVVALRRRPRLV